MVLGPMPAPWAPRVNSSPPRCRGWGGWSPTPVGNRSGSGSATSPTPTSACGRTLPHTGACPGAGAGTALGAATSGTCRVRPMSRRVRHEPGSGTSCDDRCAAAAPPRVLATAMEPGWAMDAACASLIPELWFPDQGGARGRRGRWTPARRARSASSCLATALVGVEDGIWGGLPFYQRTAGRVRIAARRRPLTVLERFAPWRPIGPPFAGIDSTGPQHDPLVGVGAGPERRRGHRAVARRPGGRCSPGSNARTTGGGRLRWPAPAAAPTRSGWSGPRPPSTRPPAKSSERYESANEPDHVTYVRCGSRRADVCPSCSAEYAADVWHS